MHWVSPQTASLGRTASCEPLQCVVGMAEFGTLIACAGISLKTQELFLLVFCTRYLDLFFKYISLYNSVMKILYIGTTGAIVHMMRFKVSTRPGRPNHDRRHAAHAHERLLSEQEPFKTTYDKEHDSFLHVKFAVAPCAVLAFLTVLFRGFSLSTIFFEVRGAGPYTIAPFGVGGPEAVCVSVAVDVLDLPGGHRHPAPAHRAAEISRGGEPHRALHLLPGGLPSTLHPQLGK
jgi:hypothetical protein